MSSAPSFSDKFERLFPNENLCPPIVEMARGLGYVHKGWKIEDYVRAAIEGRSFTGMKTPGYESIVIWGPMGTYKSNLAMQIAYSVYKDWDEVLNKVVLTEDDLTKLYEEALGAKIRIPVVILDDITTSLPKQLWFFNRKRYTNLQRLVATIRSQFCCIIATSPRPEYVIGPIAETARNEILTLPNGWAIVNRYIWLASPKPMESKFKKIVIERKKINPEEIPKEVFMKYDEKRGMVGKKIIAELKGEKAPQKIKIKPLTFSQTINMMREHKIKFENEKARNFLSAFYQKLFELGYMNEEDIKRALES